MLRDNIRKIFSEAKERGWVMEPQAKDLLRLAGMDVSRFLFTADAAEAIRFADEIKYPVVAKVVSPDIIHKSDASGVVLGIPDDKKLGDVFTKMSRIKGFQGIIVEEELKGIEMIVGMKMDKQFGPVILLGMGGTAVEIYKDVTIRMAPLREHDTESMMMCLTARPLLEGYRGSDGVNVNELKKMLLAFSSLVMEFEKEVDSVDLNPVICNASRCVVADARIMLTKS
ncbi:MAG: acetate--CoA ligase family protein [Proteobacteria bacterium]|nr:acetate--CoA ligase family protein [Pseudomonadota bacterium]